MPLRYSLFLPCMSTMGGGRGNVWERVLRRCGGGGGWGCAIVVTKIGQTEEGSLKVAFL